MAFTAMQPITNRLGQVIGYSQSDVSTGDRMLYNRSGRLLGFYRARADITTMANGSLVGYGDLLYTLIENE